MAATATKYDFTYFQDNTAYKRKIEQKPNLRVVKGGMTKAKKCVSLLSSFMTILAGAFLISLMVIFLRGNVKITELTAQCKREDDLLASSRSEYSYLSSKLNEMTGLSTARDTATRLEMMSVDQRQITYVKLNNGGELIPNNNAENGFIKNCLLQVGQIIDDLDP